MKTFGLMQQYLAQMVYVEKPGEPEKNPDRIGF
jgi:hypothetical protein